MHHLTLPAAIAVLCSLSLPVLSMPTNFITNDAASFLQRRGGEGEPFTCPDPGRTSSAKQALLNAGAQSVDIAIAMLENGCAFTAAFSIGNNKVGDNAEIGVYRNNWHMLRTHCDHFAGAGEGEWMSRGQEAHNDVGIATGCQRQLWDKLGADQFFGLQRGGTGNMGAGAAYGEYVRKYNSFIQADGGVHLSDGMATYYNVPSM